ncbi:hypothetical protein EK21DRAFT_93849 [Setomelanomma holmii]|uniref:Uncharacterized protein n=1 Tax=Setomelanomma holmii TaxID=210430 RepID=A0A9P4H0C8_9PLEO|nr:hypothetical protein EK21DRAFT_93849 [Setomelanomma holmii]
MENSKSQGRKDFSTIDFLKQVAIDRNIKVDSAQGKNHTSLQAPSSSSGWTWYCQNTRGYLCLCQESIALEISILFDHDDHKRTVTLPLRVFGDMESDATLLREGRSAYIETMFRSICRSGISYFVIRRTVNLTLAAGIENLCAYHILFCILGLLKGSKADTLRADAPQRRVMFRSELQSWRQRAAHKDDLQVLIPDPLEFGPVYPSAYVMRRVLLGDKGLTVRPPQNVVAGRVEREDGSHESLPPRNVATSASVKARQDSKQDNE